MVIKMTKHAKEMMFAGLVPDAYLPCNGMRITQEGGNTKFEFLHEGNPVAEFTWGGVATASECLTVMYAFELRMPIVLQF